MKKTFYFFLILYFFISSKTFLLASSFIDEEEEKEFLQYQQTLKKEKEKEQKHKEKKIKKQCKEEIEKYCPNADFTSKTEKQKCITFYNALLSEDCQLSNINNNNNIETNNTTITTNFQTACKNDILSFCDTKRKTKEIKNETKCKRQIKKNISFVSINCKNFLENGTMSTKEEIDKQQKKNLRKVNTRLSKAIVASNYYINNNKQQNNIMTISDNAKHPKETDITINKESTIDFSDKEEFQDNGNESGGTIIIGDGISIRASQLARLREKHKDIIDKLDNDAYATYIQKYFSNKNENKTKANKDSYENEQEEE